MLKDGVAREAIHYASFGVGVSSAPIMMKVWHNLAGLVLVEQYIPLKKRHG